MVRVKKHVFKCLRVSQHKVFKQSLFCLDPASEVIVLKVVGGQSCSSLEQCSSEKKEPVSSRRPSLPANLLGLDVYKAQQTVHWKQLFQPSGPGHGELEGWGRRKAQMITPWICENKPTVHKRSGTVRTSEKSTQTGVAKKDLCGIKSN